MAKVRIHPKTCRAAVFEAPGTPMRIREFDVPQALPPGSALCRIRLSTICGSDLHTIAGRRSEPVPAILGHESVGEIVAYGPGAHYWNGEPLQLGDRVSWTIMAFCGDCFFCGKRLPQKCVRLRKYGHTSTDIWPGLTGGYAEYIYLFPGTGIFRVPPALADKVVAPANCALSTALAAFEAIGGVASGESVLISGAGLLGVYLAVLAREAGANPVMIADMNPARAEAVCRFGVDATFAQTAEPADVAAWARTTCSGKGVDVAFEACGDPRAATASLDALRIGGRLLVAGMVAPGSQFPVDGHVLIRKCLTIRGIHNYHPVHLGQAIDFLVSTAGKYPYAELVSPVVGLDDIQSAIAYATKGQSLRVGIQCGDSPS